jgi:hypothetical protein
MKTKEQLQEELEGWTGDEETIQEEQEKVKKENGREDINEKLLKEMFYKKGVYK